jgi:biopolymer transport protein TolQ
MLSLTGCYMSFSVLFASQNIAPQAVQASPIVETTTKSATAGISSFSSMWGLFSNAEIVVQLVIVGLLLASVWSWAIIIDKTRRLKYLNKEANEFEEMFWSAGSLESLYERVSNKPLEPLSAMFRAAMQEWNYALSKSGTVNIEQRIDRVMQLVINREIDALEKHSGFLASLGSNGMIIGLFGTVLGIMHGFQSISTLQSTAPAISEALFATAIGLVAAIPAAIAYNIIASDINRYANRLDIFCNEFSAIVARQIVNQE